MHCPLGYLYVSVVKKQSSSSVGSPQEQQLSTDASIDYEGLQASPKAKNQVKIDLSQPPLRVLVSLKRKSVSWSIQKVAVDN